MLISKRRLRWTAIALLIVCVLVLLRPTRSWMERVLIAQALSPQLSVSELVVHANKSIVEVRDLRWNAQGLLGEDVASNLAAEEGFMARARRGWFAIDKRSLPQGNVSFPKVILQDVDLVLNSELLNPDAGLDNWHQKMLTAVDKFDWQTLHSDLSCLAATERASTSLRLRIDRSVTRSKQIAYQATQLEGTPQEMDNPLRFAEAVKVKLSQLELLTNEQSELTSQLRQTKEVLAAETERLKQIHLQDMKILKERSEQSHQQIMHDTQQQTFSRQLALLLGENIWRQLAPYGEIVDKVSRAGTSLGKNGYSLTIRNVAHGSEQMQCTEMKGAGEFRAGGVKSRYQTHGTWRIGQESPGVAYRQLEFVTLFHGNSARHEIACQHDSRIGKGTKLQIEVIAESQSGTDPLAPLPPSLEPIPKIQATRATLVCEADGLVGELIVDRAMLSLLLNTLPQGILESPSDSDEPLKYELRGHWKQPQLRLTGDIPAWLTAAVAKMTDKHSQQVFSQAQMKIEGEFNRQLDQLQEVVLVAFQDAEAVTSKNEGTLVASLAALRHQLDDISGTEFARRQDSLQR